MQDLQYWRKYAEAGFRIIKMLPMEWLVEPSSQQGRYVCTCNRGWTCKAAGKHPADKNWQKSRRLSAKGYALEIGRRGLPYYGVSLDQCLVVDVDPRNGGTEALERLEAALDMNLGDEALFVVATGGGGTHFYFQIPDVPHLRTTLKEYPGIDFKRGPGSYVMGCGSLHSSGGFYETVTGDPSTIGPAPAALVDMLTAQAWEVAAEGSFDSPGPTLVESALFAIPNDDLPYDDWLNVGLALRHWGDDAGFDLFDRWSQQSTKYDDNETDRKWRSFGDRGGRNIGTIFGMAADNGWQRPLPPAWGEIDTVSGELIQDAVWRGSERWFFNDAEKMRDSVQRIREWRASQPTELVAPTAAPEPTPAPAPEPKSDPRTMLIPRTTGTKPDSGDYVPEESDFEYGDFAQQMAQEVREAAAAQVAEAAAYKEAVPAPVAMPGSKPPAPKKKPASKGLNLPGLAGRIVDHIEQTAWAFQRPAAEATALQALSCAAWGATGFAGVPLSLITMVVALTASGKDHPQKLFDKMMTGIGRTIYPEVRSDKDFMYGLVAGDGKMCLRIDEAHAFFGAIEDPRASSYQKSMAALLLKAGTSTELHLARNHVEDIVATMLASNHRYEKQIDKVREGKGVWGEKSAAECDAEVHKLTAMIERNELMAIDIRSGIKGIHFNLMASSTPVKFNKFITAESVESGFMGRSVLFDCGDSAPPQRREMPPQMLQELYDITEELREIAGQGLAGVEVRAQESALEVFDEVFDKYIADDEKYNDPAIGGLHRRMRERVYSLASILAAGNGWIINEEIARVAVRICESHLIAAKSLLKQNEWEASEKDAKTAVTEIALRVLKRTTQDEYMNRSTFRARMEKNKTARAINKAMTGPKDHSDYLTRTIEFMRKAGLTATNGSDTEPGTRIWLTKKGQELANR